MHPSLQRFVKTYNNSALYIGFVSRIKIYSLTYFWTVALTNSVPLYDCMVIVFLFWNKNFEFHVIELPCILLTHDKHTAKICIWRLKVIFTCILRGNLNLQNHFPDIFNIFYSIRISQDLSYERVCVKCTCYDWQPLFNIPFLHFKFFH